MTPLIEQLASRVRVPACRGACSPAVLHRHKRTRMAVEVEMFFRPYCCMSETLQLLAECRRRTLVVTNLQSSGAATALCQPPPCKSHNHVYQDRQSRCSRDLDPRQAARLRLPHCWRSLFAHLLNDLIQAMLPSIYPLLTRLRAELRTDRHDRALSTSSLPRYSSRGWACTQTSAPCHTCCPRAW
jgi:hypothetical protein